MKWHTICSCNSKQDLEKIINSYYGLDTFVIGNEIEKNHFDVINTKNMRKAKIVRFYRKKWQYGYYDERKMEMQRLHSIHKILSKTRK